MRAYLELAGAMVLAGSTVVVGKMVAAEFPIFLGSGLRYAVAALVLLPISLRGAAQARLLVGLLFAQSFLGNFLFSLCLLYGLRATGAASAGVITSATPAAVGLISVLFLRERLSLRVAAGLLLAVAGVMAVNLAAVVGEGGGSLWGNLLVLGAVLCEAVFLVLAKVAATRLTPLTASALTISLGFLTFLPAALYEGLTFPWGEVSAGGWLAVLYYGLFGTAVAYLLWYRGVARVDASAAGVFAGLMPVAAVGLSWLVLGEVVRPAHLLGVLLVLGAIGLLTRPARQD